MKNPHVAKVNIMPQDGVLSGKYKNRVMNMATPIIQYKEVWCAFPPRYLSVTQPAASMPMMPKISKTATVHPALVNVMPCASFKKVGPQSNTAKRTTYTKKLAAPSIQIHLLR